MIVDDSPTIRSSLRTSLERHADWDVCGEAGDGQDGIDQAIRLRPDLILLDLSMPVMNGFEAARELRRLLPLTPILMLTMFSSPLIESTALGAGIRAVRAKSAGIEGLFNAMHVLLQGV